MSINCPFNISVPKNIKISSVPVNTTTDIPFVANPYSGISYEMGGTIPSYNSINNTENKLSYYSNNIYQVSPPHLQNTLTPCSIIGKNTSNIDSSRKCYNIYSPRQNMVGRVCTTPGTDGPLYSREKDENENITSNSLNINGNSEWVRGNQFAVPYDDDKIINRKKYYNYVKMLNKKKKKYVNYDQFYPIPNRHLSNNSSYKQYPHTNNYTDTGYPIWSYPYEISKSDSTGIVMNRSNQINDNFEDFIINNNNNFDNNIFFWIGIITILLSILFCNKIIK